MSVVVCANRFNHVGLARLCEARAMEGIKIENVIENLERSIRCGEARIEETCWRLDLSTILDAFIIHILPCD